MINQFKFKFTCDMYQASGYSKPEKEYPPLPEWMKTIDLNPQATTTQTKINK